VHYRLITQHLAHLHSIDVAAAAAEFNDNVRIDTAPALFKRLYAWIEHCPFDSTDSQKQARYVCHCLCVTMATYCNTVYRVAVILCSLKIVHMDADMFVRNFVMSCFLCFILFIRSFIHIFSLTCVMLC